MLAGDTPAVDSAEAFLRAVPQGSIIAAKAVLERADLEPFGRISLLKAKERIGIQSRRVGYAWMWVWPDA